MAQLVIAAAGAAIGSALVPGVIALGVTGAPAGWIVGSLIGSSFAPAQKVQGPRLSDLSVGSSAYGTPIPFVQGSPRLAGQIVYASSKREIATTTRQGGKGGGAKQKVTTYSYEVDLLILLTDNLMSNVTRIWSNGKLIWNKSATADAGTIAASDATPAWARIAFYSGAASQLPDPTYEAAVGTANAPAYRGRGTVFIQSLQLGNSGQIPNLTFELSDAVVISVGTEFFSSNTILSQSGARIADDRALFIFQNSGAGISGRVLREAGISSSNTVSTNNASPNAILPLTATTFLALWNESTGNAIKGTVITTTGSPATGFNTGLEYTIDASAAQSGTAPWLGFISSTQVLAVWSGATTGEFRAMVITIAGTVITPGTIYTLASGLSAGSAVSGMALLTASSAVALVSLSGALYGLGISVAGTVVTFGSVVAVVGAGTTSYPGGIVATGSGTALVAYQYSTTELRTFTLNAAGVASAVATVLTEAVQFVNLVALTNSTMVCTWHVNTTNIVRAIPLGSSGAASGAVVTVNAPATQGERPRAVALSSNKAMVVWRNLSPLGQLTYNTLTVA